MAHAQLFEMRDQLGSVEEVELPTELETICRNEVDQDDGSAWGAKTTTPSGGSTASMLCGRP